MFLSKLESLDNAIKLVNDNQKITEIEEIPESQRAINLAIFIVGMFL